MGGWIEKLAGMVKSDHKSAVDGSAREKTSEGLPMVRSLRGEAYAVSTDKNGTETQRQIHVGDYVRLNEDVKTGKDSSITILTKDSTLLSAGPNAVLDIDKLAGPQAAVSGKLDVSTGKIHKTTPESIDFHNPNSILGVRG